jgi:hypothetical protein
MTLLVIINAEWNFSQHFVQVDFLADSKISSHDLMIKKNHIKAGFKRNPHDYPLHGLLMRTNDFKTLNKFPLLHTAYFYF